MRSVKIATAGKELGIPEDLLRRLLRSEIPDTEGRRTTGGFVLIPHRAIIEKRRGVARVYLFNVKDPADQALYAMICPQVVTVTVEPSDLPTQQDEVGT